MSVVIVGGNECMEHRYKELCKEYRCKAKVYSKTISELKDMCSPDLLVLFTNRVSLKMVKRVLKDKRRMNAKIARSHSSSITALKSILDRRTSKQNQRMSRIRQSQQTEAQGLQRSLTGYSRDN